MDIIIIIIIIIITISLILETFISSSCYLRMFVTCGSVWSLHVSARVSHHFGTAEHQNVLRKINAP